LLNCPTADGVEVTAVSVLAAPGPEIMEKNIRYFSQLETLFWCVVPCSLDCLVQLTVAASGFRTLHALCDKQ
jgi:hypothetical protein